MEQKKLIIIGAGPKAMAIASKNAVLAEMGFNVPEIHIIEKNEVGANWTGNSGFTNGRLALGTSPEKDVGFPYHSTNWGDSTNEKIDRRMRDFSWQSFLVAHGEYSDWVDRNRPAPEHKKWAQYLQWVGALIAKRRVCHRGEVIATDMVNGMWKVTYVTAEGETRAIEGDGLVVTGPGKIKLSESLPNHDHMLTVESFWSQYEKLRDAGVAKIAIVGTGENAAAIALALAQLNNPKLQVSILSPYGMAFSRGESYRENRVYSDAEKGNWTVLTKADKRNFISRTDRGVFSQHAQSILDRADNIDFLPGRLCQVIATTGNRLSVTKEYDGKKENCDFDYVVMATGADQLAFLRGLMSEGTQDMLKEKAGIPDLEQEHIEDTIDSSLSVQGMFPKLHLPMLSAIAQGPGFANLSCLGRLSDRILSAYVER